MVDIDGAFCDREVEYGLYKYLPNPEAKILVLISWNIFEFVADAPEHQIAVASNTNRRIGR